MTDSDPAASAPPSEEIAAAADPSGELDARAQRSLRRGQRWLEQREYAWAEQCFAEALHEAPDDPRLLQARAAALQFLGRSAEAVAALRRALERQPADAALHSQLGSVLADAGDMESALPALRRGCELAPASAAGWFNLGKTLRMQAQLEESLAPLRRALALAPAMESAHFLLAEALMMLGRIEESAAQYRQLLEHAPQSGLAWWGLANLKSTRFDAADVVRLRTLVQRVGLAGDERIAARFALAKALDDQALPAEAFAAYRDANALARPRFRWNAEGFRAWVDAMLATFEGPAAMAPDARLGEEVIFVVGMPRSASTLTEQILAAHAEVEGGSELPDLGLVISEESRRRGTPFPSWVPDMAAGDWQRLGRRYLERTAQWRARRPRFTDKTPSNWLLIGALRAMLPGAHIVDCRRDALETCWSCFRQIFWSGHEYSYDFDDLADYCQVYHGAMRHWHARAGGRIHEQVYEALLADPEGQTRTLLDACGLPFDEACLRPHEAERGVRTASAAQVRQPLRSGTARAPRYGALLDPLRLALQRRGLS